jgi:hypothetical protein
MSIQFGRYLRNRRNFLTFSLAIVGVPCALIYVWNFGKYGGAWFQVFLVVVGLGTGFFWGVLMWEWFVKRHYNVSPGHHEQDDSIR